MPPFRRPRQVSPEALGLACVRCAESKTRCDRKAPSCTRCARKKFICRPRVPKRRDAGPSPSDNHESRKREPGTVTAQAGEEGDADSKTGPGTREATNGIWMDWSLHLDSIRTVSHRRNQGDAAPDQTRNDLLAHRGDAHGTSTNSNPLCSRTRPDTFIPSFMDLPDDLFDFTALGFEEAISLCEDMSFVLAPGVLPAILDNVTATNSAAPMPPPSVSRRRQQ